MPTFTPRGGRRRLAAALAAVVALAAAPAAVAEPLGPFAGYTFDPLAPAQPEDIPTVEQPNTAQLPVFDRYFGSGMLPSTPDARESITVGTGADDRTRVYVVSSNDDTVRVYDAAAPTTPIATFGQTAGPARITEAAGIAFWEGEVYVVDRSSSDKSRARVVVYDALGAFRREIKLVNPLGTADMTGVDVGAGEVWVTGGVCGGYASVIQILDARTGALKGMLGQVAHFPAGDPTKPCDEFYDPSSWWDLSLVPEHQAAIAGYRMVRRGVIAAFSTLDPELTCTDCFRRSYQDGTEAVPGMRWYLAVDGYNRYTRGTGVTEFAIAEEPAPDTPFLTERRRWAPKQAEAGGVRDVAYQNRETRIDASGRLMSDEWLRGEKCLTYVVSDADIFLVGDKGERWFELARNFEQIELRIDGVAVEAAPRTGAANARGEYCVNTADARFGGSGPHRLELVAHVAGKRIELVHDRLRFDVTSPTGAVDGPPRFVRGSIDVAGTIADAHAGRRDWQPEVRPAGGSFAAVCSPRDATGASRQSCPWSTTGLADGAYVLRARLRDAATDAQPRTATPSTADDGNVSHTAEVTTTVDNTRPSLTTSGELRDRADFAPLYPGEPVPLRVDLADSGSGATRAALLVDGVEVQAHSQACPNGGCALGHTFSFDPSPHADGAHEIEVRAADGVGNVTSERWTIDVEYVVAEPDTDEPTLEEPDSTTSTRSAPIAGFDVATSTDDPTRSLLACTGADEPANFEVFDLGAVFESLPTTIVFRRCDVPDPLDEGWRANFVSYIYGSCDPVETEQHGCSPPLEVQSWPACERALADYTVGPDSARPVYQSLLVRGASAASFEDGHRLEVYTGGSTVVIFGEDAPQVQRAADALRRSSYGGALGGLVPEPLAAPLAALGEVADGALEGTMLCD